MRETWRGGQNVVLRANLLRKGPLEGRISELCEAPGETVFDVLADLTSHLDWGGRRRSKKSRLLSLDAPHGPASVGTEFTSVGEDSMARMTDRSVVTEVIRPRTFEFVTESSWELKRSGKRADWTIVHRYDLAPAPGGCRVTYTLRGARASALPGLLTMFRVPFLRPLAVRMSMAGLRGGLRNLVQMAEERTGEGGDSSDVGTGDGVQASSRSIGRGFVMTAKAYINLPGEGEAYWAVGAKGTIKGPNVYELENPPGWEIPLHVHDNDDEVHYYMEGNVVVTCGDDTFKGEPGTLAFLPKGVPHALRFDESSRGRWLWISPQNRDELFREAGVPASEPEPSEEDLDMDRIMGIFEKNGMRFLEDGSH